MGFLNRRLEILVSQGLVRPRQARADSGPFSKNCLEKLRSFLETERVKKKVGRQAFADFERKLQQRMAELQRDIIAEEMAHLDVDAEAVLIEGKPHRRVLRQSQTYMTSVGEVVVERTLCEDRSDDEGEAHPDQSLGAARIAAGSCSVDRHPSIAAAP
jgi:hypothetical protein